MPWGYICQGRFHGAWEGVPWCMKIPSCLNEGDLVGLGEERYLLGGLPCHDTGVRALGLIEGEAPECRLRLFFNLQFVLVARNPTGPRPFTFRHRGLELLVARNVDNVGVPELGRLEGESIAEGAHVITPPPSLLLQHRGLVKGGVWRP